MICIHGGNTYHHHHLHGKVYRRLSRSIGETSGMVEISLDIADIASQRMQHSVDWLTFIRLFLVVFWMMIIVDLTGLNPDLVPSASIFLGFFVWYQSQPCPEGGMISSLDGIGSNRTPILWLSKAKKSN
jgi:hypothetical protein